MEKTEEVVKKINLAVYVLRTDEEPTADDMHWLGLLKQNNVPIALFINEINAENKELNKKVNQEEHNVDASAYVESHKGLSDLATVIGWADFTSKSKRLDLLDLLGGLTPLDVEGDQTLLQGLVEEGDTIILVCPIDSAAPKGRLNLPQVQTIREILDYKGLALL